MKNNFISAARRIGSRQIAMLALGASLGTGLVRAEQPASPSDLLEKGIYLEETKGDIDSAIKIYEQAVGAGKAGQSTAAQAQFRLGVCFYKKKQFAEANAAFEKLIKDYPDEKDLAARARDYLGGDLALQPAPWADGEKLVLDIKFPAGLRLGSMSYTADSGEIEGRKIWRLACQGVGVGMSASSVEADADTFQPIHSRWKHSVIGDAEASYGAAKASLKLKGKDKPVDVEYAGPVYDNEEVVELMRRLPLAAGYKTTFQVLPTLTGGRMIRLEASVSGPEKVTVPAGTFDCYKLEFNIKQTFWYSADARRYVVKFEAGGAVGELVSISRRQPGEPTQFHSANGAFAVTAPADWLFFERSSDDPSKSGVVALAPAAEGLLSIESFPREELKPGARKSPRDWAGQASADLAKQHKDFAVRADSWKERTVGGRPGASFTADYVEGEAKKVMRGVYFFGETNSVEMSVDAGEKEFEGLAAKFEGIVDSFKSN